jgi:hypothetical protein
MSISSPFDEEKLSRLLLFAKQLHVENSEK